MNYFVHPQGICESSQIGARTRIWAFAHVLPHAHIGSDCNICDHVFVENDVVVGDRVTVKCGVQLWDGLRVEDDVFIGPNATVTNDKRPRSKAYHTKSLHTFIERGASIGANATILPGITIGQNSMVGAGAVVTRSVPPNAIIIGNPARIVGYITNSTLRTGDTTLSPANASASVNSTSVKGVTVHRLPEFSDIRGSLCVGEFANMIPFQPKRYFLVYAVPSIETRGEHAHRRCHQFLLCVSGSCRVLADDGIHREEFLLDTPHTGIHIPPMIWGAQYQYSKDAVLLVFASEAYEAADYIREYGEFQRLSAQPGDLP